MSFLWDWLRDRKGNNVKHFTDFVYRFRTWIIIVTIALTVFFGYQLRYLRVNSDVISYLPKSDKAVALFNEIGEKFQGNSLALIAIEDPALFSRKSLVRLDSLTENLKQVSGVSSVTSISNIIDIKKTTDGLDISKLIDLGALPDSQDAFDRLKQYALSKEMYKGRLVSIDGKTTVVVCQLSDKGDKMKVVADIKRTTQDMKLAAKVYFGGMPEMIYQISTVIFSDLTKLIPIVSLLIVLSLFVSFGTLRGVVVPLLSVLIATVWTLGAMSFFRIPLTIISDIIPVLLIAVGTAPCIHILGKFDEKPGERYGNRSEGTKLAFREVGIRVILAATTIIFGFTSFIFGSYLTMIKEFGIFSALGVFFSLLVSTMFVPSLLTFITVKSKTGVLPGAERKKTASDRIMAGVGAFVLRNEVLIMACSLVALIAGIVGFPRVERKVDIVDYFKQNSRIQKTEAILESRFGGSRPIYLLVKGDLQSPFVLKEMRNAAKYMKSLGCVQNPQSVADLIVEMNDMMVGERIVPDSRAKVSNLYFLLEGQDIVSRLVNSDKTEGVLMAMVGRLDLKKMRTIVDGIDGYVAKIDTALMVFDLAAVPEDVRQSLYKKQVSRIGRQVLWDIKARAPGLDVSQEKTEAFLGSQGYLPSFATAPDSLRKVLAITIGNNLIKSLCPAFVHDSVMRGTLTDDIHELCQDTVAFGVSHVAREKAHSMETVALSIGHTGMPLIYKHLDDSLVKSQIESFIIALVFIYVLIALQLRSLIGGLFGLIPIVLTVVLMFGIMGFTGIPIDVATVLAASVALGIGIDYSIHFSIRFKTFFRGMDRVGEALDNTLKTTGRAIIINVLAVTMGFVTLMFAQLVPLQHFGALVAITMIGSGLGALTLLPALVLLTKAGFMKKWEKRTAMEDLN
jgi:predicted RND superfamily exporter protein